MAAELPHYEILAVRYGTSSARPASQNFIMSDGHDGPMPMDFYIWVIRGEGRTIVVDTGFSAGASERRNRRFVHATGRGAGAGRRRCRRRCRTW